MSVCVCWVRVVASRGIDCKGLECDYKSEEGDESTDWGKRKVNGNTEGGVPRLNGETRQERNDDLYQNKISIM